MLFHLAKHQIASIVLMLAAATGGLTACTSTNSSESTPAASQTAKPVEIDQMK